MNKPFTADKQRGAAMAPSPGRCPVGRHLIIDFWGCDQRSLTDEVALRNLLSAAADAAGATVMSVAAHRFDTQGVTAVAILAESHISIHTWPESKYAGVDIYTCGDCDPMLAHEVLKAGLSASRGEVVDLTRGHPDGSSSLWMLGPKSSPPAEPEDGGMWFCETGVPGRRRGNVHHTFRMTRIAHRARTRYQEYLIFDNPIYGRVLSLDGIVQLSTHDEHIYHEMLIHPAMFTHPDPRRVLIVGGGDGGALREVLRHGPDHVVMIDIDEDFVRAAAAHLPTVSAGSFDDPRVSVLFEDACVALRDYESAFDVAIIDCNDAVGPSEALFEADFYATVDRSLADDGICAVQAGSTLDPDFLQQIRRRVQGHLGDTARFRLTMPSYHCGEYLFLVASRAHDPAGPDAAALTTLQAQRGIVTRYWSPGIHKASQVLPPQFAL